MINDFKRMFGKLTSLQVAAAELAEAELSLLVAESGVEYAASLGTSKKPQCARLKAFVAKRSQS